MEDNRLGFLEHFSISKTGSILICDFLIFFLFKPVKISFLTTKACLYGIALPQPLKKKQCLYFLYVQYDKYVFVKEELILLS